MRDQAAHKRVKGHHQHPARHVHQPHAHVHHAGSHHHHAGGTAHHGHHAKHGHEPAIYRSQATLQAFDSTAYLATIQLLRSPDQTISGVPVSRAIPSANMTNGSTLAVIFFDHHNSADAMVVGVH